jgi:hypothetical protein
MVKIVKSCDTINDIITYSFVITVICNFINVTTKIVSCTNFKEYHLNI